MNNSFNKATCDMSYYPGKNAILSFPKGTWTKEDAKNNRRDVLEMANKFKNENWAFIAFIEEMEPIRDDETMNEFTMMHNEFYQNGCKIVVFVVENALAIKLQSKRHRDNSDADLIIDYVKTKEEAIEVISKNGL